MAPILSTTRHMTAGEVVLKAKPEIHVLFPSLKGHHCDYCMTGNKKLKRCSKCMKMFYCGRECQQKDWRNHKYECSLLAEHFLPALRPTPENRLIHDYTMLVYRLWLCLGGNQKFGTKKHKLMGDLKISLREVIDDEELFDYNCHKLHEDELQQVVTCLRGLGLQMKKGDAIQVLKLLSVVKSPICQPFHWCYLDTNTNFTHNVGFGLFPQLVAVHHSCLPNTAIVTNGLTLQLRAMTSIPVGSAVTRSYIDLVRNKTERQELLENDFGIDCKCVKCEQDLDSAVDYEELKQLMGSFNNLDKFLHFSSDVSPTRLIGEADWKKAHDLISSGRFKDIVALWRQIYPDYHPLVTEYLMASISLHKDESPFFLQTVRDIMAEIEDHMRVTHGQDHPIYLMCSPLKFLDDVPSDVQN